MPHAAPDTNLSAPEVPEFLQAVREGRFLPRTLETVHAMGKMYLASFLSGDPVPPLDAV